MSAPQRSPDGTPHAPFKGLVPYGEEDAALFFGRDSERSIIVANLRSARFVLLYGPSGVGKSSVVGAGVAHFLRQRARQTLRKRGTPEFAIVLFNQWRDDPIQGLLGAVRESVERLLAKKFEDGPDLAAKPFAEQLKVWAERAGGDLLIILDQFEDWFLYHPNEDGPGSFATEFPRVVTDPSARVNFLISIREDAVAKLDKFEGRIPGLFDNYIRIDHLDRDSARDAITRPIEEFNKSVGDAEKVSIEPELVEAVLDQVKTGQVTLTEAGAGRVKSEEDSARIETPFLQLVMTRLWDEELRSGSRVLRLETLQRLGGAERIVRTHLDHTMSTLPAGERDLAARMFHYLVTPSGAKIAHTARDLGEYIGAPEKQVTPVLEKLSGTGMRVLRPVAPPPDQLDAPTRYEIFHDVLAPAMLDWRRRYLQERRTRRVRLGGMAVGAAVVIVVAFLLVNLMRSQQQLEQKAQEAESLSQAILSVAPTGEATIPPTLVAIRETAAAVGTSAAQVTCQGGPSINFAASKSEIVLGSSVLLQWKDAERVTDVSINPGIGAVEPEGTTIVQPTERTTYTLTATGCGGSTTRSVTVNVVQPTGTPPPTATPIPPSPTPLPPSPTPVPPTNTARPRPTATALPPTATTISAPPGVYVTGMRVNPPEPRAGDAIFFYATFLNTTGSPQQYRFCVELYLPDNYPAKSDGITTCTNREIPVGQTELDSTGWNLQRIGGCQLYLAVPISEDASRARNKFTRPDGSGIWLDFNLCP